MHLCEQKRDSVFTGTWISNPFLKAKALDDWALLGETCQCSKKCSPCASVLSHFNSCITKGCVILYNLLPGCLVSALFVSVPGTPISMRLVCVHSKYRKGSQVVLACFHLWSVSMRQYMCFALFMVSAHTYTVPSCVKSGLSNWWVIKCRLWAPACPPLALPPLTPLLWLQCLGSLAQGSVRGEAWGACCLSACTSRGTWVGACAAGMMGGFAHWGGAGGEVLPDERGWIW